MGQVRAAATTNVSAPPAEVLAFLRNGEQRPRILTGNYTQFSVAEEGVLAFHWSAGRRERDFRLLPSEADGVITERDELSSFVNTWEVKPSGQGSTVTLAATWDGASGFGGLMEGLFAPLGMRKIYSQVLDNLAAVLS
ncbi:MAG: SRPBCC family protein [Solirubrobacterales bacterium]|nr:SRPBCC family protein [Solirubrobacterales bacterium]